MDKKNVLLPFAIAMGAALIYFLILTSKERALNNAYSMAQVIVARYDIPPRTVLKSGMADTMEIPRKYMDQDAFEVKSPSDLKMVDNLVTRVRIPMGDQIRQSDLTVMSPDAGLSVKIPPGYRGAILPVDPDLSPLIKPGDRVDVLVTFTAKMADGHQEKVTATILQDILVLAVGRNMGQGLTGAQYKKMSGNQQESSALDQKAVISLALNPDEAQYLALSRKEGDTTVILRGQGDVELHPMEMASFRRLFSH
ncbi:MAG: Flp pilus assembly protein CpaB [Elusimicrobiota bacterium]